MFDWHVIAPIILKRRTVTSDGRALWASIPEQHWSTIIRDRDELLLFRDSGETKTQWDRVPTTIIFGSWKRVMLLSDTYKVVYYFLLT